MSLEVTSAKRLNSWAIAAALTAYVCFASVFIRKLAYVVPYFGYVLTGVGLLLACVAAKRDGFTGLNVVAFFLLLVPTVAFIQGMKWLLHGI